MSEEAISSEMIKVCINNLNSEHMTNKEQALKYFNRKRLKRLSTWQEWKNSESKQEMYGDPIHLLGLPKNAIILNPHWQYLMKPSGA